MPWIDSVKIKLIIMDQPKRRAIPVTAHTERYDPTNKSIFNVYGDQKDLGNSSIFCFFSSRLSRASLSKARDDSFPIFFFSVEVASSLLELLLVLISLS